MSQTRLDSESFIYRTIPYSIRKASTFFSRLKGLMFRINPLNQEGLWILPCNSIHMCFMFFPIDVIFLDKEYKVVKLVRGLKPWRIVSPVSGAHSVLELPVGTIDYFQISEGQYIEL
ncbi:DUF192 domain-containing protein [Litchfieldia salsa]|uniref:DUF192 domain-containing protein n=1 Tax=Litchfieldia salsa TaxID=930152 RepID=A0A1H0UCD2_9BACI|nr:DUF192 domain-containing protein [Litchfieldia salsa]SDP63839.1 hypothetical protein SAMN05216565_104300 [Litchfieldia salsa]